MPAGNTVECESPVIEQAGWASLVGGSGDAGCPLCGSRAVARSRRVAARGPGHPWQAGSCVRCCLGSGNAWRESGREWIVGCRAGWPGPRLLAASGMPDAGSAALVAVELLMENSISFRLIFVSCSGSIIIYIIRQ
jgi:hypothetical protein